MGDTSIDNLDYFYDVVEKIEGGDKFGFMIALIGSLAAFVEHDIWKKGVDLARVSVECSSSEELLRESKKILNRSDI